MHSDPLLNLVQQLYENQLELRRNLIGLLGGLRAVTEQLHEQDLLDAARWERDKLRFTQEYEQLAAKQDDEQRQEQAEALRRQMLWQSEIGITGGIPIKPQPEPSDDGPTEP